MYKKTIRWSIIALTIFIVSLILWNTYSFFQKFKDNQRAKMEILAAAYKRLNSADLNAELSLERQIIKSNSSIPMLVTNAEGKITQDVNLGTSLLDREVFLKKQLELMKAQNPPIIIQYKGGEKQSIYYKDSQILTNLKYYPLALILVLLLFFLVIYLFTKSTRVASENILWTGMAKETAHQIGTPLSSLMGWVAILKEYEANQEIATEIEKDITRLEVIANRFSKIGSESPLQNQNIVALTKKSYDYLASRSSKRVNFIFNTSSNEIKVPINVELFGWVIENLVKNAIDAMQGKGTITLNIVENTTKLTIEITDTGKGIPKSKHKEIFEPGYTTKKRGWGLGLSLSKRIIEDFHKGKIYVKESKKEVGTTFCVELMK